MNKQEFFYNFQGEDEFIIASIWEDILLAQKMEYPIFTKYFITPNIWSKLMRIIDIFSLNLYSKSLTVDSEKKILCFAPKGFDEKEIIFPTIFFKIDGNNKFKTLQHKDFLGSIMSLGVRREILGDIIVKDSIAFSVTTDEFYPIISNLNMVNKIQIKISEIDEDSIPNLEFEEKTILVTSLRIDSIVASLTNISRNSAIDLIEQGDVFINYITIRDKSKNISIGDTITIRKKGKFIILNEIGESKKGKLKLLYRKFI